MLTIQNRSLGKNGEREIIADLSFPENASLVPLVIFCHGFKGFKNWGPWEKVAEQFALKGYAFLKFNFSHNGVGSENMLAFNDLDGFALNSYNKELDDLEMVLQLLKEEGLRPFGIESKLDKIFIIGHSRGGGIALTKTAEDPSIEKVATWASISTFERFGSTTDLELWKKDGVKYILNGRTKQQMPQYFSFYEDFKKAEARLNIEWRVKEMKQPLLIAHGKNDKAVGYSHALRLKKWHRNPLLVSVENANHVFNAQHPFEAPQLPVELQEVVNATIAFFKA